MEEHRAQPRVHYARPNKSGFLLDDRVVDIVDVSEGGLRYRQPSSDNGAAVGNEVTGIVWLRHGDTAPVMGTVVRVTGNEVAALLDEVGIPRQTIFAERCWVQTRRGGMRW